VILDVARLVAGHCDVPETIARDLRTAYIRTTSPTFLIFAPHQEHPLFVVKVEEQSALEHAHARAARLYELLPNAIAKPYGVFPLAEGAAASVQEGLPGHPWFRLGDQLGTTHDWLALRDRCTAQLREFQRAVAAEPAWVATETRFGEMLTALAGRLDGWIAPLGAQARHVIEGSARTLTEMGPVRAQWQHGDFVVNNLLVDAERLGIVDLHDFGRWQTPLLDGSALACSINMHASSHVRWHPLDVDLAACTVGEPGTDGFTAQQKMSFFVFYLLAAITDTLQLSSRATIRLTYLELLRNVAAAPAAYERAFRG
jgi:hypothetical protein